MKKTLLLCATVIAISLSLTHTSQAEMTNSDVQKIVESFIMENPETILKSVNDYQTKGVSERQEQALTANKRKIYDDSFSPITGNENGDVIVVEFFDYNCGYCKRAFESVDKLIQTDKGVKFVFKEFPILGPTSETAARWALAAHNQGKYTEFHTQLMKSKGRINDQMLENLATSLSLDVAKLKKDAQSDKISKHISENRALAQQLGVTGTPGFIIGDE